jgi:acetyl-CoA/propionyl-CoA carboxylase biotin carboxyl carrier protein
VTVTCLPGGQVRVGDGPPHDAGLTCVDVRHVAVTIDGLTLTWAWAQHEEQLWLGRDGDVWRLVQDRETIDRTGGTLSADGRVTSPMPGTVLAIYVSEGDAVEAGSPLVTVEAMKMEHVVRSPARGVVAELLVVEGEAVRLDQSLATITIDEAGTIEDAGAVAAAPPQ